MTKVLALASRRPAPEAAKPPWVSQFTEKVGQRICDEIAAGRTLHSICSEVWAPKARMVYIWFAEYPDFRADYEEARRICADHLARQIVELADAAETDLDMAKLPHQISAREWLAQRMDPQKYGDRKQIETNSTINANVRSMSVTKLDVSHLSSEEILIVEKTLRKALEGPGEVGIESDNEG